MNWTQGRQKTGYLKKCIINSKRFKFDIYLLKYPEGSEIPKHIDSPILSSYEHHRVNIILKKPKQGGDFYINDIKQIGRFFKFRPDIQEHHVTKIISGQRYVLSIGWCLKRK